MKTGIMRIYCFVQESVGIEKLKKLSTAYITQSLSKLV